jgi:hypothetical protein
MQVFIQCSYLLRGDRSEEAVSVPRNALSFVQTSLGSTYSRSLGPAATVSAKAYIRPKYLQLTFSTT